MKYASQPSALLLIYTIVLGLGNAYSPANEQQHMCTSVSEAINQLDQRRRFAYNVANMLTHGRCTLLTYMFVLQLRVNKREISVHIGQQRGGGGPRGVTWLIHMFSQDLFKAFKFRMNELLTFRHNLPLRVIIIQVSRAKVCDREGNRNVEDSEELAN